MEYPKMLYKLGGALEVDGKYYSCTIVETSEQEKDALKNNWSLTPPQEEEQEELQEPFLVKKTRGRKKKIED